MMPWCPQLTGSGWPSHPSPTRSRIGPRSYIVTLAVTVSLTTGDTNPDPVQDQLPFHKQ
jgi:hypothetical protein